MKVVQLEKYLPLIVLILCCLATQLIQAQDTTFVRQGPPPPRDGRPVRKLNNADPSRNAGKVEWQPRHVDMGIVKADSTAMKTLTVKNISQDDLIIFNVKTTCHCTWAEWPYEAIKPGQTGQIKVYYHGESVGEIFKILSIQTNFDLENWVLVTVYGTVQ